MTETSDGGIQPPSGLRGDPDVPRTSGYDTRDKEFASLSADVLRLRAEIQQLTKENEDLARGRTRT